MNVVVSLQQPEWHNVWIDQQRGCDQADEEPFGTGQFNAEVRELTDCHCEWLHNSKQVGSQISFALCKVISFKLFYELQYEVDQIKYNKYTDFCILNTLQFLTAYST